MPDPSAKHDTIARLLPVAAVFLAWLGLGQIIALGRRIAPNIATAGFQRGTALVLALVLATGWLVALWCALRATGRVRLASAAAALVFAALCFYHVVLSIRVGEMSWQLAANGMPRLPNEDEKMAKMIAHAFDSPSAEARHASARFTYRLHGYRIVYKDENGIFRPWEPPPDDVKKYESTRRAKEETRALLAGAPEQADHIFWIAGAYLFGLAVMLVGSAVLVVWTRPRPTMAPNGTR